MHEVRIDPLSGLRAIVATDPEQPAGEAPLLSSDASAPAPDAQPGLYTALAAGRAHELIANGPPAAASLTELTVGQLQDAVELWRERMRAHDGAAYVHVCVDEPPAAGTAPAGSHAQLYALDFVPAAVARERERFSAHAVRTMGANLLEDLVQEEVRRRERIVAIDDEAVLFCPYASRGPYALMLVPRRPRARFEHDGPSGAALLHDGLARLARHFGERPPLSLWVRTAPRDAERFCWRIDILPRLTPASGLELGAGLHRTDVAPELAAAQLRAARPG
ncbi:MAG: UDPglucose--hexose-phosphate uridylyltransferase [Solirubrobacteraceae bacterium]|jgi:UDPglucose--hexose-1-phosphate uridylyltransferase|nr:UDPglucose--hexose-phosphate uridylyltransferase [Solirubrobacteraceae bacterium]